MANNITEPLRVSAGSHKRGSGTGCAMNVVSWINGDAVITDYPECSASPLATLVQTFNDALAYSPNGYVDKQLRVRMLSPEDSAIVVDLGIKTIGTSAATVAQCREWLRLVSEKYWPTLGTVEQRRIKYHRDARLGRNATITALSFQASLKSLAVDLFDMLRARMPKDQVAVEVESIIEMWRKAMGLELTQPVTDTDTALAAMSERA